MNRKLQILSLAFVAAFMISAVSASSAFALKDFRSEGNAVVTLTGSQEEQDVLLIEAGKVKCTSVTYHGTVANSPTTTVQLTPAYSGCTLSGLFHATIATNGCFFQFHINGETANGTVTGSMDIVCAGGGEIVITAESGGTIKCTIKIPAQNGLGQIEFTNVNPGLSPTREVTVDMNLTGITHSLTAGTGAATCTTLNDTTNGTYTGKALVTGENDGGSGHVGVYVE